MKVHKAVKGYVREYMRQGQKGGQEDAAVYEYGVKEH